MNKNYSSFNPFEDNLATKNENTINDFNSSLNQKINSEYSKQAEYSPSSGYYYPKRKEKEKKKVSLSVLIASCIICALISGLVASGAMMLSYGYINNFNQNDKNSPNNTIINVEETSVDLVSAVAKKVIPSVVGIRVIGSVNSFFGFTREASSEGSGVIYANDGYIITNYHVISMAINSTSQSRILVYLADDPDTAIEAKVIGFNSDSDLAVIKIEKTGLTPVEIGDSSNLSVGETAIAVGNPGGLEYMGSVSRGVISGLDRTIKLEGTVQMKVIQTDAAINPGNSGGALVNHKGQLIGINSSKISDTAFEGMGFAIPSNQVVEICDKIINNRNDKKAYVGITISTKYTGDILKQMGYPAGAVVESVAENSPAAKVGIKPADIITEFNGVAITNYNEYNNERLKYKPGDKVSLTVFRNGKYYSVEIVLGESYS